VVECRSGYLRAVTLIRRVKRVGGSRAEHDDGHRGKSPVITGWLPDDPDDPPKLTWRGTGLIAMWIVLLLAAQVAIPNDWGFWPHTAALTGLGVIFGLALRLSATWFGRSRALASSNE
jgi:hypothetical protein